MTIKLTRKKIKSLIKEQFEALQSRDDLEPQWETHFLNKNQDKVKITKDGRRTSYYAAWNEILHSWDVVDMSRETEIGMADDLEETIEIAKAYDKKHNIKEDDERFAQAVQHGKGKVDTKALMSKIGGRLEMSPEERLSANKKMGLAEDHDTVGDNTAEIEAEVWGTNSANADKRWVKFTVQKPTSFSEIEVEAIDYFYHEGGQGDDPFVNSLTVDGNQLQEQITIKKVPPGDPVVIAKKVKETMVSHMLYHHDHGTSLKYWNPDEIFEDIKSDLKLSEEAWIDYNPRVFAKLFEEALKTAQEEINSSYNEDV